MFRHFGIERCFVVVVLGNGEDVRVYAPPYVSVRIHSRFEFFATCADTSHQFYCL